MFKRKNVIIKNLFNNYDNFLDKEINVCGWIETFREQQKNGLAFISLSDGSSIEPLQIILNPIRGFV